MKRESVQPAKAARSTKDAEIFSSDPMAHTSETVTTTGAFWKLRKGYAGPDFHVKQPASQIRALPDCRRVGDTETGGMVVGEKSQVWLIDRVVNQARDRAMLAI